METVGEFDSNTKDTILKLIDAKHVGTFTLDIFTLCDPPARYKVREKDESFIDRIMTEMIQKKSVSIKLAPSIVVTVDMDKKDFNFEDIASYKLFVVDGNHSVYAQRKAFKNTSDPVFLKRGVTVYCNLTSEEAMLVGVSRNEDASNVLQFTDFHKVDFLRRALYSLTNTDPKEEPPEVQKEFTHHMRMLLNLKKKSEVDAKGPLRFLSTKLSNACYALYSDICRRQPMTSASRFNGLRTLSEADVEELLRDLQKSNLTKEDWAQFRGNASGRKNKSQPPSTKGKRRATTAKFDFDEHFLAISTTSGRKLPPVDCIRVTTSNGDTRLMTHKELQNVLEDYDTQEKPKVHDEQESRNVLPNESPIFRAKGKRKRILIPHESIISTPKRMLNSRVYNFHAADEIDTSYNLDTRPDSPFHICNSRNSEKATASDVSSRNNSGSCSETSDACMPQDISDIVSISDPYTSDEDETQNTTGTESSYQCQEGTMTTSTPPRITIASRQASPLNLCVKDSRPSTTHFTFPWRPNTSNWGQALQESRTNQCLDFTSSEGCAEDKPHTNQKAFFSGKHSCNGISPLNTTFTVEELPTIVLNKRRVNRAPARRTETDPDSPQKSSDVPERFSDCDYLPGQSCETSSENKLPLSPVVVVEDVPKGAHSKKDENETRRIEATPDTSPGYSDESEDSNDSVFLPGPYIYTSQMKHSNQLHVSDSLAEKPDLGMTGAGEPFPNRAEAHHSFVSTKTNLADVDPKSSQTYAIIGMPGAPARRTETDPDPPQKSSDVPERFSDCDYLPGQSCETSSENKLPLSPVVVVEDVPNRTQNKKTENDPLAEIPDLRLTGADQPFPTRAEAHHDGVCNKAHTKDEATNASRTCEIRGRSGTRRALHLVGSKTESTNAEKFHPTIILNNLNESDSSVLVKRSVFFDMDKNLKEGNCVLIRPIRPDQYMHGHPWIGRVISLTSRHVMVTWLKGSYGKSWYSDPAFHGCQPDRVSRTSIMCNFTLTDGMPLPLPLEQRIRLLADG